MGYYPCSANLRWRVQASVKEGRVQAPVEEGNAPRFLLVFGMARSGTSWIGKIFDSHPLTLYKHEPDRGMSDIPMFPRLEEAERFLTPVRRFFAELPGINGDHAAGSFPVFPKQYRSGISQHAHRASVLIAKAGSALGLKLPVLQCARINTPDLRVVWKSIDSVCRLGVILRIVQNCRAIRITRHPCGSISSTLRGEALHKFSTSVSLSEYYGSMQMLLDVAARSRGLTLDHLRQFHPVERMAWMWVLMNEKVTDETQNVESCMTVRYEDVCRDPSNKMQELFSFARLIWNEQTSNFIKASTLGVRPRKLDQLTKDSERYYGVFKDPIQAAYKWKREMKPEDIERVYRVLRQSDLIRLYPESEDLGLK